MLALAVDEKINWFQIIVDLERMGYRHNTIAACIGVGKSTVSGWKQGASPRFEDGEVLIGLWEGVTKNGRESVHKVKRHSYRAY